MAVLDIYRNGSIIASPEIDERTVLVKKLMNADRVNAAFVSNTVLPVEIGDYITVSGNNYYINQLPTIDKENDNSYKYDMVFQGVLYDMFSKLLISSDGLSDFSYSGNAQDVLTFIVSNMNQISSGWAVGDVDDSELRTFQFTNDSCRSALTKLSEEYNLEFQLESKTIHLKEAVGTVKNLTFRYGKNNGLYTLTRKTVESKTLVTRLYAFGASKNLTYTYRDNAKRLVFEERYLEENVSSFGVREGVYTNEDIYPNRTATLTAINGTFNDETSYVSDSTLDFDINDYLAEGLVAKIVFKTGNLRGYEFEIWKYDHTNKRIYFNAFQESNGYIVPNENLLPEVGDTYTLVDINMPQSYIITAENNLKAAAQKYLDSNCFPKSLYLADLDQKYVKANAITLDAGDLVKIVDSYLGVDRAIRVNQITYPIVNPNKIKAVIADFIPYSLQEQVTKSAITTTRTLQNIYNTVNNSSSTTVINNSSTTINNNSNVKKITINGQEFWWEKGYDNNGTELEAGDVIYGNYWNRYIFVKKWTFLGGIKELRTSWDELETIDETPEA
ncbi:phage tail protein [Aestuariibaculum marinum]|uniref:Tail spike domain-containing protein n=1 Tax=Aestuariibaculum marinum TaxID=2683592 RepID=A0A8J6PSD5_9FLAO|nr:hypothetical protein [Aestuariibaculum marinum]MBD0822653.1 hypothetical protein [Aestuariibaculum marinum]